MSGARDLGLVGAGQDRLDVAAKLKTLEHLLIVELVLTAGGINGLLGAGDARSLARDLVLVAETNGHGRSIGVVVVVAFELGVRGGRSRKGLGLPFVVDVARLDLLDAREEAGFRWGRCGRSGRRGLRGCRPRRCS
jgi:hypothetical protein